MRQCKITCAADYQNRSMFSLLKCDGKLLNQKKKHWKPPTKAEMERNHNNNSELKRKYMSSMEYE